MVGWVSFCSEFFGSAFASYAATKSRLERQDMCQADDFCPYETKHFIAKTLEDCSPSSLDLTLWGRKSTEFHLGRNSYFAALLAIDGNTQPTKRSICILALKVAAKCICSGYDEDLLRAATYTYLAAKVLD
jgi:hypothetical protein